MRRDLVGQHALLHIVSVRQPQMLFGRDVAQHGSAVPADHGRADGAGDVVITRSDIDHQRTQRIEGRFVAQLHLFLHLQFDLIHGDVPRTLDHHLDVVLPGFLG